MVKVLFICHGNICRSPMAEYLLRDMVRRQGLAAQFQIASAATSREEIGKASDEGEYFRVPLDARSLQYELYFDEGESLITRDDDYTSENTNQLSLQETQELLLKLPEIQQMVDAR